MNPIDTKVSFRKPWRQETKKEGVKRVKNALRYIDQSLQKCGYNLAKNTVFVVLVICTEWAVCTE